jgi:hypothetical protein
MSQYSSPKLWGPQYWFVMRCVAANYPKNPNMAERNKAYNFYNELTSLMPCETCRTNYSLHAMKYPLRDWLDSRDRLISWVELINQLTTNMIIAEKKAKEERKRLRNGNNNNESSGPSKKKKKKSKKSKKNKKNHHLKQKKRKICDTCDL